MNLQDSNIYQTNQSPLNLKNYLSQSQLEEIIKCQQMNQCLSITSHLNSDKAQLLGNYLFQLNHLQSLKIRYIETTMNSLKPLISLGESLEKFDQLGCLEIYIDYQEIFDGECVNQLFQRISTLKKLSELSLITEQIGSLNLNEAKGIKKSIKMLTNLTHLSYNLEICTKFNTNILNQFLKSLKHLINLTHLKFILHTRSIFGLKNFQIEFDLLASSIMNLSNLKQLYLQIDNHTQGVLPTNNEKIILFSDILPKFQSLEKVNIQFKKLQLDIQTTIYLINALFKIQSLEELEFYVMLESPQFTNTSAITQSIKENSKLKKLVLDLNSSQVVPNKCNIDFGEGFQYLTNMQHLSVVLNRIYCDEQSFLAFDSLFQSSKLEYLKLEINCSEQQYTEQFCRSLRNLTHLKVLKLFLSQFKLFPKFRIAEGIQGLEKLEKLKVYFSLSYFGAEKSSLIPCFQSLKNLKELNLKFESETRTENTMTIIGKALNNLSQLVKLELNFSQIINFDRFSQISESLRCMTQLKVLKLSQSYVFSQNPISQNQFFDLITEIKNLNSLRELLLNFYFRVLQADADKFALSVLKHFEKLDSLRKLTLREISTTKTHYKITRKLTRLVEFQQ